MTPPLPLAILFDLDETIITEGKRHPILRATAASHADALAPHAPHQIADALERALTEFWSDPNAARTARLGGRDGIRNVRLAVIRSVFAEHGIAAEAAVPFHDDFVARRLAETRPFESALETLATLRAMKVKMALVTNGAATTQRAKIERFALAGYFDHIHVEGEHGFGKPDDRAYRHAMSALEVIAKDTWMVGDNLEWEVTAP